ncbi:MAG TPA: B12-binding domain-containing radical SAM protein [Bryobacteraceae bacterium]|nr:B12-binding domain-containing radical SAM protein [Bryobacteraceae bacterium]
MIPEKATSPPLGLITVAALCPSTWTLRLIDRAFEELRDEDLQWADLVMVSAMHAQRDDARAILARARALGRRTIIGGPWASSDPEAVLPHCDHVVVGEVEEAFARIAEALANGAARRLYRISDKPDMSHAPVPRFDLLRLEKYSSMSVQFSRGCPFQCEFCDIITIYGRRPRTKTPTQLLGELDTLLRLGWRNEIFIVDDNFIGNSRNALQLARELTGWQERHGRPFAFYTEASIDLADRPELLAAMVEANFLYVFIGIESPSAEALNESKKFQNLRRDSAGQIRVIQDGGLWVLGGFIVGFDSDDETIFDRQLQFIEKTAIPWAMAGMLQAPPTTPLHARMKREGRLIEESEAVTNFSPPNFRTVLPLPVLLRGLNGLLRRLYEPEAYFSRAFRSLQVWRPRPIQRPPRMPLAWNLRATIASVWRQGLCSGYRLAYWGFLFRILRHWTFEPAKLWMGFMALASAHHFLLYSRQVSEELETACRVAERSQAPPAAARVAAAGE